VYLKKIPKNKEIKMPPELAPLHEELISEVQYLSKTLEECDKLLAKLREENQKLKSSLMNLDKKQMPNLSLIRGD